MPEGHTLHRLAGELQELVGERVSAASPQGRFPAAAVDGAVVAAVEAYGKHLLVDLAEHPTVHVHLGMRGKLLRFAPVTGAPMPQVRLRLATADVAWDLIAPSTCEPLDAAGRERLLAGLGPDPLRAGPLHPDILPRGADAAEARRRLRASRGSVGVALMDQSVLAGVGNVFRAEILHALRIAPERPASRVSDTEFDALWSGLAAMMGQAVEDGRIITVDVPAGEDRLAVPEAVSRRVYRRDACADCGTPVVTTTLQGRTSYACPRCQPD
ncbi:endonuclease-8 [Friedmanniella luteola]|uniref:DNA-(apurinic or apyrimidinic site) lyase n=1 Tax=Friedmanniella luteola TaxID=546871 RepID=A0A1H1L5I7_9ACTN|nr:DNA-formamidopyrimidine glycosylase family protein [Friedmanniella luteola]SDR69179.1 endonuclease-8 [Friedmanniella luteola]